MSSKDKFPVRLGSDKFRLSILSSYLQLAEECRWEYSVGDMQDKG